MECYTVSVGGACYYGCCRPNLGRGERKRKTAQFAGAVSCATHDQIEWGMDLGLL